jgi:hypothetical protein
MIRPERRPVLVACSIALTTSLVSQPWAAPDLHDDQPDAGSEAPIGRVGCGFGPEGAGDMPPVPDRSTGFSLGASSEEEDR